MMEKLFEKIGTPYKKEEFAELFEKAKFWLRTWLAGERIRHPPQAQLAVLSGHERARARMRAPALRLYRAGRLHARFSAGGAVRDPQARIPRQGGGQKRAPKRSRANSSKTCTTSYWAATAGRACICICSRSSPPPICVCSISLCPRRRIRMRRRKCAKSLPWRRKTARGRSVCRRARAAARDDRYAGF